MKFKVLTYNNGVGIVTDGELITKLIKDYVTENVTLSFVNEFVIDKFDVGVWIQNFDINLLNNFKKNIFFINEEWSSKYELDNLHLFDYVICKNSYAKELLKNYDNIVYLPFISKDLYDSNVNRSHSFLHFMGRSIQKNTELVLKQNVPITLIDPYNIHRTNTSLNHINTYQTNDQIVNLLNSHNIHICCSIYESWGHYLFEGLSTGTEIICSDIPAFKEQLDPDLVHFIPTKEKTDPSYCYCSDNQNNLYPLRKSFFVDEHIFNNTIKNFVAIGKNEKRRKLFKHIIDKNKRDMLYFLKNL